MSGTKITNAASNLAMLAFVAKKLGPINKKLVFLGGCATSLLITDAASPDVRATIDVDCIVDVISLVEYHHLENQLVACGFKKSLIDDVICR